MANVSDVYRDDFGVQPLLRFDVEANYFSFDSKNGRAPAYKLVLQQSPPPLPDAALLKVSKPKLLIEIKEEKFLSLRTAIEVFVLFFNESLLLTKIAVACCCV